VYVCCFCARLSEPFFFFFRRLAHTNVTLVRSVSPRQYAAGAQPLHSRRHFLHLARDVGRFPWAHAHVKVLD
jgi:hypothetical protein